MKPIKTRPFISITGQDWSYVLHHYTRDREKLLQWRGEGYPIYTYNMHLLCDWSECILQGVCAILIFNKYTYFWQFAYLSLLSMWKYTYFQPKWMKRQKLGKIWRNCLQFMKYLDISMIFCSFSYMKSYVLLKTEQKLIEVRMEMSLWLKFFGAIF